MPTFGTNTDAAARIINSTIAEYNRKETENIMAKYALMAMFKSKGCIRKCPGGDSIKRAIRFKRNTLHYMTDLPSITFQPTNKRFNVSLNPKGYWASDAVTMWQRWSNTGPAAIIDVTTTLAKELMDDFKFGLNDQPYADGNAATTLRGWDGLETFFSISGAHTNAMIGAPNDTYAGQSTAFGTYGTWSEGTFPNGRGSVGYHAWSPLVGLYDAAGYGGSAATWAGQCLRVLRRLGIWNDLRGHKVDLWLLQNAAYNIFANAVEARETIRVERGPGSSGLIKLGFGNVINFENTDVTFERGVPAAGADARTIAGYGLNFDDTQLSYWTPELIWSPEMDFSAESLSQRHTVGTMSNLYFNPQAQVKICYTSGADSAMV